MVLYWAPLPVLGWMFLSEEDSMIEQADLRRVPGPSPPPVMGKNVKTLRDIFFGGGGGRRHLNFKAQRVRKCFGPPP